MSPRTHKDAVFFLVIVDSQSWLDNIGTIDVVPIITTWEGTRSQSTLREDKAKKSRVQGRT